MINNENVVKNYKDRQGKMAINMYFINNNYKYQWSKSCNQRHMMADWIIKQECTIILLTKRPTLGQQRWTDWKWGNGNVFHVNVMTRKEEQHSGKKIILKQKS